MKKAIYNPTTLPPTVGNFERAVRFGDWLFISGCTAVTNVAGSFHERKPVAGIEAQAREAIDNIERVLVFAGGGLENIYELRLMLKEGQNFSLVDSILKERIPGKGYICHAYEVNMVRPTVEIEIEASAYLGPLCGEERIGHA